MSRKLLLSMLIVWLSVMCVDRSSYAGFHEFVIRNGSTGKSPTIQSNKDYAQGATEFIISGGGMKAGWGSNDLNGYSIGDIGRLSITRYDDTSRFSAGSGPAVAPYFNFWVTDGSGHFAVIANEPSSPAFQPLFTENGDGSKTYDLSFDGMSDQRAKVYETPGWNSNSSWIHDLYGPDPLTFSDLASLRIAPPPPSYIQDSVNGVGSGAPDVIDTDIAYGFTWVFGDTLSNYVSGDEGYIVAGPVAAPVAINIDIEVKNRRIRLKIDDGECKAYGKVWVVIYGTSNFDATTVNKSTAVLGDPALGGAAQPIFGVLWDLDRDGYKDCLLFFSVCQLYKNGAIHGDTIELVLTGLTNEGVEIIGSDEVRVRLYVDNSRGPRGPRVAH
ncbi:hypothetical protein D1BOALGB6SA_2360 [Olavius sp. associated proteobacterium Delta 1]|nr:hypothetical protein D1BOALGB6SA_2360 [Olavius sp. associated proteobacterium Delta 1]